LAPAEGEPVAAVVLLHPHPEMGGDRLNNVVTALYLALPPAGLTALRFDFGSSDFAAAEAEVIEALDLLDGVDALAGRPRFVAGYSFGGGVGATVTDDRVAGWFLAAPALSMVTPSIGTDPRPKAIVAAEHDQFFAPAQLQATTEGWTNTELTTVAGADHFFVGRTDALATRCVEWIRQVAP
jgi:hypothetical protein